MSMIGTIAALLLFWTCAGFAQTLKSPNGQISLNFDLENISRKENCPVYNLSYKGKQTLSESRLGFTLDNGNTLDSHFKVLSTEKKSHDNIWKPIHGERSSIRNHYNQMTIQLSHQSEPSCTMELVFRCYDSGLALRYRIPKGNFGGDIAIKNENTEFRFPGDHLAWATQSAQGEYTQKRISELESGVCRPLTIKVDDNTYAAVAEAALVNYARTQLAVLGNSRFGVVTDLSSEVEAPLPFSTPWRVVMVGSSPGELLENNDIILNLNEPCQIENTSWIRPGKAIRVINLNTETAMSYIDFADKHNMQFIEFDTGWYGPEFDTAANPMTVASGRIQKYPNSNTYLNVDLDLPKIIQKARSKDIGVILYVNHVALENYPLDKLFATYNEWGVAGVKFGFVNVGSQYWTSWLHKAIREAAKNRIMVDIHDEYRPTGYSRTYPNLMTMEGIRGDEATPSTQQTLTTLFTRMLAGAGDNTICYYSNRVDKNWSHAYQLAKSVCMYSPWQFLFWYDRPLEAYEGEEEIPDRKVIRNEPELEFFKAVPTVWDETRVLRGSIGKYAIIARRSGEEWYIGGMNSDQARSFEIPLEFLEKDQDYMAHIYFDDPTVKTRTEVGIKRSKVDAETVLDFNMKANGGQAVRLVPEGSGDDLIP